MTGDASESSGPLDVIVMDVQMPGIDRHEAARGIHEKGYAKRIIALTAHAMQNNRQECIDTRGDGHAGKPLDGRIPMVLIGSLLPYEPATKS